MVTSGLEAMLGKLDDAFQAKARLGIMAALAASESMDFNGLKRALSLSDGNLSSHLSYLEKRGFVRIEKSFAGRRSHTEVVATDEGWLALEQYLDAIEEVVSAARGVHA